MEKNSDGEAISKNDVVAFYYSMSLLDGSELDSYMDTLQILPLGLRQELYEDGVLLHNVAPYSPVLYEVELVDVK